MKKAVLKLDFHDYKMKQKAMTVVSSFSGVESISLDMKDNKLTVTGDIDPVTVVKKLRKRCCYTEIVSVGPAKEPEKKKEEPKKDEPKKTEKKKDPKDEVFYYQTYYHPHPQMVAYLNQNRSVEEDPNACVIC